jgi:hypothetical protein
MRKALSEERARRDQALGRQSSRHTGRGTRARSETLGAKERTLGALLLHERVAHRSRGCTQGGLSGDGARGRESPGNACARPEVHLVGGLAIEGGVGDRLRALRAGSVLGRAPRTRPPTYRPSAPWTASGGGDQGRRSRSRREPAVSCANRRRGRAGAGGSLDPFRGTHATPPWPCANVRCLNPGHE